MADLSDYESKDEIAWCPGCGDFGILAALKQALAEMDIRPENLLIVSGIGQAAKLPHYLKCNVFNGLHGRALPAATGARIANRGLTVIAEGGDGDGYAEGGNHFIHSMRRNLNITYLVHDNQIYGLTKGQASPTTGEKTVTGTTPYGVFNSPENPLALAISSDCSFVARGFSGRKDHLVYLIKEAVRNEGFSLIDILQPCVSYNKVNTFKWYADRVYELGKEDYNHYDRAAAFNKALEWGDKIPIGIIYRSRRKSYENLSGLEGETPLFTRKLDKGVIDKLCEEFL
jgi:2-oxoglutarate/2-oxoacid ferredoxin oxidoreductase subunit beta